MSDKVVSGTHVNGARCFQPACVCEARPSQVYIRLKALWLHRLKQGMCTSIGHVGQMIQLPITVHQTDMKGIMQGN